MHTTHLMILGQVIQIIVVLHGFLQMVSAAITCSGESMRIRYFTLPEQETCMITPYIVFRFLGISGQMRLLASKLLRAARALVKEHSVIVLG